MATGFVKHFRQAGALCLSGQAGSQVSQGDLFIICTAAGRIGIFSGWL